MKKDFEQELIILSEEQKQAVDAIYGPVLLIAGPGAGKTRVLTMRIANILHKTDYPAKNILALTFTENATAEMQERLAEIIGAVAYDVNIKTFHAFANDIIQQYPEKFINTNKLEAIDDLAHVQLIKNILLREKLGILRTFTNFNGALKQIRSAISTLKREGYSPRDYKKLIEAEVEEFKNIPNEEKYNPKTGKMKGKYSSQEKKIKRCEDIVILYEKYEEEIKQKGLYDYDDMILFVLEQLKKDEDLLYNLREEYQFILIDEFQDTNNSQLEIIKTISEDEKPNIFAVGDADQSIYRFQGASMENILRFKEYFPDGNVLQLSTNYRSSEEVVNGGQALIQKNTERMQNQENLDLFWSNLASHKGKNNFKNKILELENEEEEKTEIANWIQKLNMEGKKFSEMAIIVRKNIEGSEWLKYLEKNNIPAVFESKSNALDSSIVRQFLTLLKLIEEPLSDELFFKVVHFNFLKIPEKEIWKIFKEKEKKSYFEHLSETESDFLIKKFSNNLLKWQKDLHNMNFPDFLRKIFTESELLNYLIKEDKLKVQDLNNLSTILSEAERLYFNDPDLDIKEFLNILKLREEFDISLNKREFYTEKEAVRIITGHKAKGLEYPVVFIPSAIQNNWGKKNDRSINLLIKLKSQENSNSEEEERRLFYVAMTRAEEMLFISYFKQNIDGKEKNKSKFVAELEENAPDLIEKIIIEKKGDNFEKKAKIKLEYQEKNLHKESLEIIKEKLSPGKFKLSHTVYEDYQVCPRKCLYEHVLALPRKKPYLLLLGTAVHKGLEVYFQEMINQKKEPKVEIAIQALKNSIYKEKADKNDKELALKEGERILEDYFAEKKGTFGKPADTEYNFRKDNVLVGVAHLTGKIDKIEFIDPQAKTVKIIDYKSGTPKSEGEIKGTTQKNELKKGNYYRQLLFFGVLAKNSESFSKKYNIQSYELHFLKPQNGYVERKFMPNAEEIEQHKKEIIRTWEKIQNLDFSKLKENKKSEICEKIGDDNSRCPYFDLCWGE